MGKMHWFRMYNDFLNDAKLLTLAFEDQRHFIGILSLKSDGVIDQDCDGQILDRIVAQKLWLDFSTILDVKKRLMDAGLIDVLWQPLAWDRRQFKSDFDGTNADRQRRYREKHKAEKDRNALPLRYITPPDTDTDTDTEKKKKGSSRFIPPTLEQIISYCQSRNNSVDPDSFLNHYETNGWMRGKTKIKDWKACVRTWEKKTEETNERKYL